MDTDRCLLGLLEACVGEDRAAALTALDDLRERIRRGEPLPATGEYGGLGAGMLWRAVAARWLAESGWRPH
jgi:hypothetical protein